MKSSFATVVISTSGWRLFDDADDSQVIDQADWDEGDLVETAARWAEVISQRKPRGDRVAILLDDDLCLATCFRVDAPNQARSREALLYKTEEYLPIAAEELAADFRRRGNRIFSIAVERARIEPLVIAIVSVGFKVEFIGPVASLAWAAHLRQAPAPKREAVVWATSNGATSLVLFESGEPIDWMIGAPDIEGWTWLRQQLELLILQTGDDVPVTFYTPNTLTVAAGESTALEGVSIRPVANDAPILAHAWETFREIRRGRAVALVDLTPEFSAANPRSFWATEYGLIQVASVCVLLALLVANLLGAVRRQGAVRQLVSEQEQVWRTTYPDSRTPRNIRARLGSEVAKLLGARGQSAPTEGEQSVTPAIFSFLDALPEELRFRIADLRIENGEMEVSGEVRDFGDADRIAAALREHGFLVKPPTTRRLPDQGVAFRLDAQFGETVNVSQGGGAG